MARMPATPPADALNRGFIQRVLFVILAIAGAFLVFKLMGLWLLIFGAIVIATVLRALAEPLIKYTPLNDTFAVLTVLVAVLALLAVTFYLFGRELTDQTQTLLTQLPAAWAALQLKLESSVIGSQIKDQVDALGHQTGTVMSKLSLIAGNVLSSVANIFVALVAGIILAINPGRYRDGVVFLFAERHKPRACEAMNTAGHALRLWFIGQFISMVLVGTLTGVGLWIVGLPSALTLGLMAGLAQFVPIVGPVASAVPGLLLAAMSGWQTVLWALVVYAGVSHLESNFITPIVQRRIASIPIIVTLFAVIGFAGLMGAMGVIFAMPLTVILYTLIRKLYTGRDGVEAPGGSLKESFRRRPKTTSDSPGPMG
ncbi:AI-2E family transporter [Asticcacaulis sp. EMRT-3]|uniref:AI-2E family transporter n=1 Tax=Asticcacaulis sp. EMRT-3 TaxID=3040349 RepID=UPI0024AEDDCA|nr:AI-2E family transporter [Asticcacaulis sp. EMRT-3]MDI7773745.1 AI-2E family transporter [Asticcacaulis sp. EMRT-3]